MVFTLVWALVLRLDTLSFHLDRILRLNSLYTFDSVYIARS